MTRLLGLISWYAEPVQNLVACLTGLQAAGVDHVVAVDGAYALYPDGMPVSSANEHAALHLACRELGLGLTIHAPAGVWDGNEVQKRTALFRLALAVSEPGDWFMVMDADQVVTRIPTDLKATLDATEHDAADVTFIDTVAARANHAQWPTRFAVRILFRAQPITVRTNHMTYVAADGRVLWGWDGYGSKQIEALDLTRAVEVEHRPDRRSQDRQAAKLAYYRARDEARVERGPCAMCGAPAMELVAANWRLVDVGPVSQWTEACAACAEKLKRRAVTQLHTLGVDPDAVAIRVRNVNGPLPELAT